MADEWLDEKHLLVWGGRGLGGRAVMGAGRNYQPI